MREQIETIRLALLQTHELHPLTPRNINALCDLALQALDRQWIAVEERLPEANCRCIKLINGHLAYMATGEDIRSWARKQTDAYALRITHWQSLPPPPSQQGR